MKPSGVELRDARLLGYEVAWREMAEMVERIYTAIPRNDTKLRHAIEPLMKEARQRVHDAQRGKL